MVAAWFQDIGSDRVEGAIQIWKSNPPRPVSLPILMRLFQKLAVSSLSQTVSHWGLFTTKTGKSNTSTLAIH